VIYILFFLRSSIDDVDSQAEQRQDQNAKRRKLAADAGSVTAPSPALQLTAAPTAPTAPIVPSIHPSLPQRPSYDFPATADSIGLGAAPTAQSTPNVAMALQAVAGSNHDVVANRKAIRLANMSAAQMLKAELSGKPSSSPERDLSLPPKPSHPLALPPFPVTIQAVPMSVDLSTRDIDVQLPGLSGNKSVPAHLSSYSTLHDEDTDVDHDVDLLVDQAMQDLREDAVFPGFSQDGVELSMGVVAEEVEPVIGVKRKIDEVADDAPAMDLVDEDEDEDAPAEARALVMKVNPDGTVEQEDMVK
jgi:5'-3' exoribonuclease 2